MKPHRFIILILVIFITANCALTNSMLPDGFQKSPASVLTPASLDAVIGRPEPLIAVDDNWLFFQNDELGFSFMYPPSWHVGPLKEVSGTGLYPPESDPNFPTPMIRVEWLNIRYASGKPILETGSPLAAIEVSGITGQQYQDNQFALPTQSYYVEIPYRDGTLFFIATLGPSVNLVPQFTEIRKTVKFLN
jgi:hypothetical protein